MKTYILVLVVFAAACGREEEEDAAGIGRGSADVVLGSEEPEESPEAPARVLSLPEIEIDVATLPTRDGYVFTNRSPGSVWYSGYVPGQPSYGLDGRGETTDWFSVIWWCGTGLEMIELPAGARIEIHVGANRYEVDVVAVRGSMFFATNAAMDEGVTVFGEELAVASSAR